MAYAPRPGGVPEGFVQVANPNSPDDSPGVVPLETLDHWQSLGWALVDPSAVPADDPAPEGASPTSEED